VPALGRLHASRCRDGGSTDGSRLVPIHSVDGCAIRVGATRRRIACGRVSDRPFGSRAGWRLSAALSRREPAGLCSDGVRAGVRPVHRPVGAALELGVPSLVRRAPGRAGRGTLADDPACGCGALLCGWRCHSCRAAEGLAADVWRRLSGAAEEIRVGSAARSGFRSGPGDSPAGPLSGPSGSQTPLSRPLNHHQRARASGDDTTGSTRPSRTRPPGRLP